MPFNPKANQIFHLILCSNYEAGVRRTRDFYCDIMGNPKYAPDNSLAYERFRKIHPDLFVGLRGARRPPEWLMLWKIVSEHEEGISDCMCRDFYKLGANPGDRQRLLEWLEKQGYVTEIPNDNPWGVQVSLYRLDWLVAKERLGIEPPAPFKPVSLRPLSVEDINK
jgi:hypothetical protein